MGGLWSIGPGTDGSVVLDAGSPVQQRLQGLTATSPLTSTSCRAASFSYRDSLSDDDWSGKIQLNFRPKDEWLLYAGVSRGIKSGGFNLPLFPIAANDFPLHGETLTAYEVGIKTDLRRDSGSTRRPTTTTTVTTRPTRSTASRPSSSMPTPSRWAPSSNCRRIRSTASTSCSVSRCSTPRSPTFRGPSRPRAPRQPALSPDVTFNGLVRYEWPALGGFLAVQADYGWQDDQNFNLIYTPVVRGDAYGLANARLSYTSESRAWTASVWVKNLTDENTVLTHSTPRRSSAPSKMFLAHSVGSEAASHIAGEAAQGNDVSDGGH